MLDVPDDARLLPVVTGTTLLAELADRPAAERLRERISEWSRALPPSDRLVPVVCADVWYLNQPRVMEQPGLVVGPPSSNAASAFLANRLPTSLAVDGVLQVCMDPDLLDLRACLWGATPERTADAVACFAVRYLDRFLRAAHDLPDAATPD